MIQQITDVLQMLIALGCLVIVLWGFHLIWRFHRAIGRAVEGARKALEKSDVL